MLGEAELKLLKIITVPPFEEKAVTIELLLKTCEPLGGMAYE